MTFEFSCASCGEIHRGMPSEKERAHNDGIRPYIEIEPTDHPLAVEQREGISVARVAEIYAQIMHEKN